MKKNKECADKTGILTMTDAKLPEPPDTKSPPHSRLYIIGKNASMFALLGSLGGCVYGLFGLNYEVGSNTPVFTGLAFAAVGAIFGVIVGIFTKQKT